MVKLSPRDFTPYRLNPLTDFDAVWFICSRILFVIAWRVTRDHRLFLNTNIAGKPEAHRIQYNALLTSHISWPPDEMSEKSQRLQKGFCQPICKEHNQLHLNIGRHRKYKMTAAKPEVIISDDLKQIDTRFQWLYPGFWCRLTRQWCMKFQYGLINWIESVLTQLRYSYFRFGSRHLARRVSVDV